MANILRHAARAALHFLKRKDIKSPVIAPHQHEWKKDSLFITNVRDGLTAKSVEFCPKCGALRPPQPQGKAWDLRRDARKYYPGSISQQRKWIKAWKRSPGASVPISTQYESPPYQPWPLDEGTLSAQYYLRMREREQR